MRPTTNLLANLVRLGFRGKILSGEPETNEICRSGRLIRDLKEYRRAYRPAVIAVPTTSPRAFCRRPWPGELNKSRSWLGVLRDGRGREASPERDGPPPPRRTGPGHRAECPESDSTPVRISPSSFFSHSEAESGGLLSFSSRACTTPTGTGSSRISISTSPSSSTWGTRWTSARSRSSPTCLWTPTPG